MTAGLIIAVAGIGLLHGVLPDHGWPIAATYALRQRRRYVAGIVAGLIIGIGHLLSSIALVVIFVWMSDTFGWADTDWLKIGAGVLLIGLGIREYRHGHHPHHHDNGHSSGHGHSVHPVHGAASPTTGHWMGWITWIRSRCQFGPASERGLPQLAAVAVLLGIAHEEPVQILAICAGTAYCLELMLVYSAAVIVAILVPTLLLIAGYERHRATVERFTPHLSKVTAALLIGIGTLFITGIL
ncbi:hypothetical protein [Aquisalimonas sp.]|uniref:hypothetical protein n=1 Tax=Aquisalimonas sp. TaxID=1872621 RepID=UPI0025BF1E41|nr:hypothetical protein [Aquisalimonas sp.]